MRREISEWNLLARFHVQILTLVCSGNGLASGHISYGQDSTYRPRPTSYVLCYCFGICVYVHMYEIISDRAEDIQEQIYYLTIISTEYLASFINRVSIIQENTLLYQHTVAPNLLFEKVITELMACQEFTPFFGTDYYF